MVLLNRDKQIIRMFKSEEVLSLDLTSDEELDMCKGW